MKKAAFCTILLVLGIFLLGALPAGAASRYTCKALPPMPGYPGNINVPSCLNNSAQVSGYAQGPQHAFLYTDSSGVMQDLGTLPAPYNVWSDAFGINDAGQVVGRCASSTWGVYHVFLSGPGGFSEIGPPPVGPPPAPDASYHAQALTGGKAAGWWKAGTTTRACTYENGEVRSLFDSPPFSEAYGLNTAGDVVGRAGGGSDTCQGFLYSGGSPNLLGTLPAPFNSDSIAIAINAAGQVVGNSYKFTPHVPRAFLWTSNGGIQDLGTLPAPLDYATEAKGINAAGQVVGTSKPGSGPTHAFLYSGGVMSDLNSLVVNLPEDFIVQEAFGINDRGQIIASAYNSSYTKYHNYLLTPVAPLAGVDLLLLD
jgi:probable HAF family extracellular repeat protein